MISEFCYFKETIFKQRKTLLQPSIEEEGPYALTILSADPCVV